MIPVEREFAAVLTALQAAEPTPVSESLASRVATHVTHAGPPRPQESFAAHRRRGLRLPAQPAGRNAAWAEDVLVDAFLRAGPSTHLPRLGPRRSHTALEALAKSTLDPAQESLADRALILERKLGLSVEDLARTWAETSATIRQRLADGGARSLAALASTATPPGAATPPCTEWHERLPLVVLDLLSPDVAAAYAKHLGGCAACATWTQTLDDAMTPTPTPPAPTATDKLAARLDPPQQSDLNIQVAVACCFCHDRLRQRDAAFCATCLAPHHPECFATHRGCATPGCDSNEVVYPATSRPPRRRFGTIGLLAVGFCAAGVAAWGYRFVEPADAPSDRTNEQADNRAHEQEGSSTTATEALGPVNQNSGPLFRRLGVSRKVSPARIPLLRGKCELVDVFLRWAKAAKLAPTVGKHVTNVRFVNIERRMLDREGLRTLLRNHDHVMVVGPGETARLYDRDHIRVYIGPPVRLNEEQPIVDPDAYVQRTVPIRGGLATFDTLKNVASYDLTSVGHISYSGDNLVTLVGLALNVQHMEDTILQLAARQRTPTKVFVELFSLPASAWAQLAQLEDEAKLTRLRKRNVRLKSFELLGDSLHAESRIFTKDILKNASVSLALAKDASKSVTLVLTVSVTNEGSCKLRCKLPLAESHSVQATQVNQEMLVFSVSRR